MQQLLITLIVIGLILGLIRTLPIPGVFKIAALTIATLMLIMYLLKFV